MTVVRYICRQIFHTHTYRWCGARSGSPQLCVQWACHYNPCAYVQAQVKRSAESCGFPLGLLRSYDTRTCPNPWVSADSAVSSVAIEVWRWFKAVCCGAFGRWTTMCEQMDHFLTFLVGLQQLLYFAPASGIWRSFPHGRGKVIGLSVYHLYVHLSVYCLYVHLLSAQKSRFRRLSSNKAQPISQNEWKASFFVSLC